MESIRSADLNIHNELEEIFTIANVARQLKRYDDALTIILQGAKEPSQDINDAQKTILFACFEDLINQRLFILELLKSKNTGGFSLS